MKKPHLCWAIQLILMLFLGTNLAWSRDLTFYHSDSHRIENISLKNTSSDYQDLWVLIYEGQFIEEIHFEIPPYSKKNISLKEFKNSNQEIALLTKSDSFKFSEGWSQNTSTLFKFINSQNPHKNIQITNLSFSPQQLEIQYYDINKNLLLVQKSTSLGLLKSQHLELKNVARLHSIEIKSKFPIFLHPSTQFYPEIDDLRNPSDKVQFLVEYEEGSQFVVQISDSKLIERARNEIQNPQGLIVFGDLSLNLSGNNRNPSLQHQPKWSWELKNVTGLEPLAADWCQVYPEMIERMLNLILEQEQVCFRGARVIKELNYP